MLTVAYTMGQNFKSLTLKRDLNLNSKLSLLTHDFYDCIFEIVKSLLNHHGDLIRNCLTCTMLKKCIFFFPLVRNSNITLVTKNVI